MKFSKMIIEKIGMSDLFDAIIAPELSDHSSDKKRLIEKAVYEYGLQTVDKVVMRAQLS